MTEQKQQSKNIFQIVFPNTYDLEFRAESVKLGLIPDEEKIKQLKAEMYRLTRGGQPIDNHVKALSILLKSRKINDKRPYSWGEQLASVLSLVFTLGLLGLGSTVIFNFSCLNNQTAFCKDVRGVSTNVVKYFMYEVK